MEDNLNMDLFGGDELELNTDDLEIDDIKDLIPEEEIDDESPSEEIDEDDSQENNDNENSSEESDDSSESVARDEENDEGGDDTSPNLYSSFAQVLHDQGLLPSLDLQNSKIESVDDISNALNAEIDSNVKNRLVEVLGEDGYEAVSNGVPLTELAEYKQREQSLSSITEESLEQDVELSKKIIYQDYLNQGISEQRAQKMLKRIIDSGDDAVLEDAKESLDSLKAHEQEVIKQRAEENKKLQEQRLKEQEKLDQTLKSKIYNSDEIIKGVKMTKALKDRVYNSMTEVVAKNDNGIGENKLMKARREDPVEFDTKLYLLYELTNGFSDFSKVVKTTQSSAISDLERAIRQQRTPDNGAPSYLQDDQSYSGSGNQEIVFD